MAKSSDAGDANGSEREIRLVENPDGRWTARDLDAEVSAQGMTRTEALEALDPETACDQDDELPDVLG